MTMFGGRLTIHDGGGALLAKVHRTEGRLYLLKLKVEDNCLLTEANDNSSRLWHLRYGHYWIDSIQTTRANTSS